jgi:uncharacterized protein (TIGR02246 family)
MDTKANPAVMNLPAYKPQTDDEIVVYNLYQQLLKSWNDQNADNYGQLFTETASVIGFDGSQMNGNGEITEALRAIFANHKTNWFVAKVRDIRFLTTEVVLLRAVAGMYSPAKPEINPQTNAIQSLVAVKKGGTWAIALFQNTPAQFHGRPDLSEALTKEIQSELG